MAPFQLTTLFCRRFVHSSFTCLLSQIHPVVREILIGPRFIADDHWH